MIYEFRITVTVSGEVTEQEALEFVGFNVGAISSMKSSNPLYDDDNDAEVLDIEIN
ncbi:hypothetical protein MH928_17345 [Flavobacterium sp. WW92]|uniref:hypothetical protein n=1 Tax=unclassified Flavobacterium TaxID=196869 RepID=UPI002224A63B|nr:MULTISPECIES: hypothetical protein [unclassified Flavobacterium]WDO13074.1 hypothetical protein MH928_17345 [Flavobacterium sp. WW92]